MTERPRLLIVKRRLPLPLEVGTDAITLGLVECLRERFAITFLAVDEGPRGRQGAGALRARGIEVKLAPEEGKRLRRHPILGKLILNATRLAGGVPREYQLAGCRDLGDLVERETRARSFALAQFEYWTMARYRSRANCPAALLNHDVWFHTLGDLARVAASPRRRLAWRLEAKTTRPHELDAQRGFEHRLFLSEEDRTLMADAGGPPDGLVVPLAFPYAPVRHAPRGNARRPVVLHVGAMSAPFNIDAVCTFAREVWPRIRDELPHARFVVAGRDPSPEVLALVGAAGIEVTGFVEDLGEILAGADVFVSPARVGTGVKIKVAQAMAAGLPVVGSEIGLAGYGDGEGLIRARNHEGTTREILRLLTDPKARQRAGDTNLARYRESLWTETARARVVSFHEAML